MKIEKENLKNRKLNESDVVEMMPVDIIPSLRFYQIASRLNNVLQAYEEIDLSYSKNNEIKSSVVQIENALGNIEAILECELENGLIYKE